MNNLTFTGRVAKAVLEKYSTMLDVTVVVPSERMISYLYQAFYTADDKPKIAPKIITIDRWIHECVDKSLIDKSHLLFRLYTIFENDPADYHDSSFDKFLTWGQLLLNDFEETDRYLVHAKDLFKNLKDVHEIESWSFNSSELSAGQQKFMAFWEKLGSYYETLHSSLFENNETTRGKNYREVAENIDHVFRENKNAHFVFAGFNAMSAAELSILRQLHTMGRADIFIDSDWYYLQDKNHEAGTFHRVLLETLGVKSIPFQQNLLREKHMEIELIECPFVTSQAAAIGTLLAGMSEADLRETVVLLADEELIPSLIRHLPKNIGKANITLGLPLKNTSLRLWVDLLFSIQENYQRGNKAVYFKDIRRFCQHPLVHAIVSAQDWKKIEDFDRRIAKSNRIFVNASSIPDISAINALKQLVFEPWENNWKKALTIVQEINRLLDDRLPEQNVVERAVVRTFHSSLIDFCNFVAVSELPSMSLQTYKSLFNQIWKTENIAYFGNPINGLQVMGLLETRGIDFKNLLVLGLNEGKMPPTNPIQTLIPMDLRRFYGLPTPREKQGLFAHHFYRLLHRAENVWITYSSATENISSAEPSRYVKQIELELSRINPGIHLSHRIFTVAENPGGTEEQVEKTPGILKRLDQLFEEGISASALKTFVECPMNFYYKYLLRLSEDDDVEETIQSSTYGTILHKVMENLFRDFMDHRQKIVPEHIDEMIKKLPLEISTAFKDEFSDDELSYTTGITQINFRMAEVLLKKMLLREKKLLLETSGSLTINGLEKIESVETQINVNGKPKIIRITGVIDRIDELNGVNRILDYKSGSCTLADVSGNLAKTDIRTALTKGKYVIQLLNYSFLYHKMTGKYADQAGILSFRNVSESPFLLNISDASPEAYPDMFIELLEFLASEMYSETPFVHNPDAKYCAYCNISES